MRTTPCTPADRFGAARAIAEAVLYEGYVLYPYRASATKNQMRWQFGVLVPPAYATAEESERSWQRTECLIDPGTQPYLTVRVRFLQPQQRTGAAGDCWDEATDHEVDLEAVALLPLAGAGRDVAVHMDGGQDVEDTEAGRVVRRREPIDAAVRVDVSWAAGPGALLKVGVDVRNCSTWAQPGARRETAMRHALVGVHTLIAVDDGTLLSLLDPPEDAATAAGACANEGTYPVLVSDGSGRDIVLSAPIILYDHPVVAPESPGDLFDSTEIDEILALRVLTLTEDEKAQARATDARAAAIVDRVDAMSPERWASLHGAVRPVPPPAPAPADFAESLPWWEPSIDEAFDPFTDTLVLNGATVSRGTSVVLRPNRRSDAHDMFLQGMRATVTGVFTDVDGSILLAVTVDDDPATEALSWQGRGLFFHPDEVEVPR